MPLAGHLGLGWRGANSLVSGMVVTFRCRKLALRATETGGWRNGHQTPRSQTPWEGIRRKAPPDIEGIETGWFVSVAWPSS